MDKILYVLPALACPVGMGAMMWMMMRGGNKHASPAQTAIPVPPTYDPQAEELAALRSEVADLRTRLAPEDAVPGRAR